MEFEEDKMTTSRELLTKEKILDVIQRMPDDATVDDAISRLKLLKGVAKGLRDVEEGRIYDDDDVFDELLNDHAQHSNRVERAGKNGSPKAKASDRKDRAKGRRRVRPIAKGGHT
jgi:hypothetical protein